MKCSKCGFNVPRGSKFCTNCGAIIKKHIARKVVASFIVIVLASGIVGGAFAWRKGIFPISKENNNNDISTTNNTTYENDESIILSEGFTSRKILDKESALAAIGDVADILGINDVYSEFGECKEDTVEGNTYYRFYQEYNGIPVYGRSIIVCADENGDGQILSGKFAPIEQIDITPLIDETMAVETVNKQCVNNQNAMPCGICIYFYNKIAYPCWRIIAESYESMCYYFVSIKDGTIIDRIDLVTMSNYSTLGGTMTSVVEKGQIDNHTLQSYVVSGKNQLFDADRKIYLYKTMGSFFWFYSKNADYSPIIWDCNTDLDSETEVDAYKYIQTTYEFFKSNFNYISTNGTGNATIVIYTNWGFDSDADSLWGDNLYDNASSTSFIDKDTNVPLTVIQVGIKNEMKYTAAAYLDIMAHEYTHGVISYICGLNNQGEAGAINEGVADILGEITEEWYGGACNWENIYRSISDPASKDCPESVQDSNWHDPDELNKDNGHVHNNSTIISRAAYLMTQGNGTNKPLSTNQLAHLIYQSLYSLPSDCNFGEFRKLVESTANIMSKQGKMTSDQLECISWAFDQVGITSSRKVDYYLKQNAEMIIYDINAEPYNNYKIEGTHIDTVINQGPDIPTKENEKFEYVIDTTEPFIIPYDSGVVLLNITDCGDSKTTYSLVIGIDSKGKDSLDVYTDFGKYESEITADYLKSLLHTVVGSAEIADFCMADFDCNGSLEAFAAVVRDDKNYYDEALYDLYFVTEKNVEKISEDDWLEFHEDNLLDFGDKKYYVVENCFTSSSTSRVYGVEDGVWYEEPSITRRGGWITQITETNSMTIINDFDYDGQSQNGNGTYGHTWKTHYLYWDNGFHEYGGIHISESQLLMCDGAERYVDMIKDSNGEISGILYRENGVININFYLSSNDGTIIYENMTLKLDGAKVTAVVKKDWTDSIEKYSEGGVYSEAFIPEIASYPESFIFSIAESTPSSGQCGDMMYWKYDKASETLEISGSGDMYDYKYTTPYEYGYNPPWNYWSQNERISNIKFNGEINEIGIGAFCYCEDIETISLPAGIKHIDEGAFDMCEGLKYVSLPEGLDTIGKDAFLLCRKLSEIHLPKSLNYIDQGAFNCCDSLTDVYYYGSKSDWKDIVINNDNDALLKANIHFMGPSSYLEELEIIQRGQYNRNMGDSFVLPLGSRCGYIDIDGNEYRHGIECWIARWNFTEEKSWAYSTFKLDGNYGKIDGKCVLIQSYNTSNFDTTIEFYGDDKLITSYHLTPDTIPFDISLDVTDVKNLTVYLADNVAVKGGTAFGLIDMSLNVN